VTLDLHTDVNDRLLVVCVCSREDTGSASDISTVVWDASGVNESFDTISAPNEITSTGDDSIVWIATLKNPTEKEADVTVTFDGTQSETRVYVFEISGADQTTPIDAGVIASTGTSSPVANSITTVTDNTLIIAAMCNNTGLIDTPQAPLEHLQAGAWFAGSNGQSEVYMGYVGAADTYDLEVNIGGDTALSTIAIRRA
jgi:hypothetical protein